MRTPEQILMRKIKKREKKKQMIMVMKNEESDKNNKESKEAEIKSESGDAPTPEQISMHKKKKQMLATLNNEESENDSEPNQEEIETESDDGSNPDQISMRKIKIVPEPKEEETEAKLAPASNTPPTVGPDTSFASLAGKQIGAVTVSEATLQAIKDMGLVNMTEIQAKAIPLILQGHSTVCVGKTGSGKTLAFLIPVVELIREMGFKPWRGTGCIILSPTRELAMQTYGVLKELLAHHRQTCGILMGGADRKREAEKLTHGINILVATPGRLLDHMRSTPHFLYKWCFFLVIDEADRMMEMGFEDEMKDIIEMLRKTQKTNHMAMLFSATYNKRMEALTRLAVSGEPKYLGVDDTKDVATVDSLRQGYLVVSQEKRLMILVSFLLSKKNEKIIVFMSTCMSVKFHDSLFNYIDLPVMSIHGKQEQKERTRTFFKFSNAESGVLLCTDIVARGLDIPAVDWIVQYDPPNDTREYIHRVGRTARGLGTAGHALLMIRKEELRFLRYLKQAKVPLNELEFKSKVIVDFQSQLEHLIHRNSYLHKLAKDSYQSYVRAYDSHHLKDVFDVNTLDLAAVAKSFGFAKTPYIQMRGVYKRPPTKRNGGDDDRHGGQWKKQNTHSVNQ